MVRYPTSRNSWLHGNRYIHLSSVTDGTLHSSGDITDTIKVDSSSAITTKAVTYTGTEGFTLTVPVATGVLANAFDPTSGATVTATVITPTINGTLELNPNGCVYLCSKKWFCGDRFVYLSSHRWNADVDHHHGNDYRDCQHRRGYRMRIRSRRVKR